MTSIQKLAVALSMIAMSAPAMAAAVAVPEPGTFGLMAVGVVALVAASFRKRQVSRFGAEASCLGASRTRARPAPGFFRGGHSP